MARIRKILCNGDYAGGSCNRWLARVEGGYVYIYCPKCRGYHKEPLTNFVEDLQDLLDEVKAQLPQDDSSPPKAFG